VFHTPPTSYSSTLSFYLYLINVANHESPPYAVFSILIFFIYLLSKYFPQHPFLKNPNLCSSFNDIYQGSHQYTITAKIIVFLYSKFYVSWKQSRKQKTLDRMVTGITRIQFHPNFLQNQIMIGYCRSQILKPWHILKRPFIDLMSQFDLHYGGEDVTYT
jgi:hypothetical protein